MSLYRYVPGKAELVDLMLDAVHGEAAARARRGRLARAARAPRARRLGEYERHPWAVTAYTRPVLGPHVLDGYEAMLATLAGSGLAPGDIVNAVELVAGYVDGAARRATEGTEAQRRTGATEEEWWSARASFWETYFDVERYPTITAMWESDAYEARADAFEFGLQRVLDGIEAYVAR